MREGFGAFSEAELGRAEGGIGPMGGGSPQCQHVYRIPNRLGDLSDWLWSEGWRKRHFGEYTRFHHRHRAKVTGVAYHSRFSAEACEHRRYHHVPSIT